MSLANGGAQPNLSKALIENYNLIIPDNKVIEQTSFVEILNQREAYSRQTQTLKTLQSLLLSKLANLETNN